MRTSPPTSAAAAGTRLYDCTIPAASTQISLGNCLFRGNRLNAWNLIADIPFTLTLTGFNNPVNPRYKFDNLTKRVDLDLSVDRSGGTLTANSGGNLSPDADITTNWPSVLLPAVDAYLPMHRAGVITYWGRVDNGTTRLVLTHLQMPSETLVNGTTVRIAGQYFLDS